MSKSIQSSGVVLQKPPAAWNELLHLFSEKIMGTANVSVSSVYSGLENWISNVRSK